MINELFERELQNTSINNISLADYIKENYVPKKSGKWIPVSDRLPEAGEEVLVSGYDTYNKKVVIAKYQGEQYGFTCGLVSAWMSLPEPYKPQETETWNGIHAQITAPRGTFERIFNEADDDNDI